MHVITRRLVAVVALFVAVQADGIAVAQVPGADDVSKQLETLRADGRYAEAITILKRLIATTEARSGLDNPVGVALLNNLGELHYKLGRYAEAIPYYERALSIADRTLKVDNPLTAIVRRNLATVYQLQGRGAEAERLYKSSIAELEKLMPATRIQLASSLNNIAIYYQETGRLKDAETALFRVLKTYQDGLPPGHPYISTALNNLAELYEQQGNNAMAELMLAAALVNIHKTLDADNPQLAPFLQNLGLLYARKQDWPKAVAYLRLTLDIYQKQTQRGAETREGELSGVASGGLAQHRAAVGAFVNSAMKLLTIDRSHGVELVAEILRAAQLTPSGASASLTQMSVRHMKGDSPLASLARERQDLVAEWQMRDKRVFDRLIAGAPANRGDQTADTARLAEIDRRIATIDHDLARDFPEYGALINPQPLDVKQVQGLLSDDEALVVFIETPSPSWVWVITKTEKALSLVNLGSNALAEEVAALRCGLDRADWVNPAGWPATTPSDAERKSEQQKRFQHCQSLYPDGATHDQLPFDLKRAHNFYKALFNGVEAAIAGKQLLIVPSQSLMPLPFQVLVTEAPDASVKDADAFRKAQWLVRNHALTVLPSVSSLQALRQWAKNSDASQPLVGFGNPLLEGGSAQSVEEARAKQSCPKAPAQNVAEVSGDGRDVAPLEVKGGLANVAQIRRAPALPETADELCAVAQDLNAGGDAIHLGANATETEVKRLSDTGELAKYKVIHFATHGALAGQVKGSSEPGLILTPPETATDTDDGYLTASEIAGLKLDADWVILSACNTAAGDTTDADALSGLARAFFYAGARALLVSHWAVNSEGTVKLITVALDRMSADKSMGRAEAMQQSMLALVDGGEPYASHPSYWAPFVVVGEGAPPEAR